MSTSTPVIFGTQGVFLSKGDASVFLSFDKELDIGMDVLENRAKKLLREILDYKEANSFR